MVARRSKSTEAPIVSRAFSYIRFSSKRRQ